MIARTARKLSTAHSDERLRASGKTLPCPNELRCMQEAIERSKRIFIVQQLGAAEACFPLSQKADVRHAT